MAKFPFTPADLDALEVPGEGQRIDYDDGPIRGFAIKTFYTGAKQFLLVYVAKATGRERRMVLGDYGKAPRLSLAAARKLATEKRALVDLGRDPWLEAKETRAAAEAKAARDTATFGALMDAYVEHLKAAGKPSWKQVARAFERHITEPRPKLAKLPADAVTVDDVMPVFHTLAKAGKLREAEKLRSYLRAAYTAARKARTDATMHAFAGFQISSNPLIDLDVTRPKEAVEKAATAARERKWALSQPQLAAYWKRIAADDSARGALLRFHLLTGGQRVEQLARLTEADHDLEQKTITLLDTKGRRKKAREHVIPLIPDAEKALAAMRPPRPPRQDKDGKDVPPGPYLFTVSHGDQGAVYHTAWEAVQEVARAMVAAGEVDRLFTPGTIRKTVETRLQAVGVSREIRGHLGSHGLGGVQGQHYEAHEFNDEKRTALKKLRTLCEPKGKAGNVTSIRRRSA